MRDKVDEQMVLFSKFMIGICAGSDFLEWLEGCGYFQAPASAKYHGNYPGGLVEHSYNVAAELCKLTQTLDLEWERPESPMIVGYLHDICKYDNYILNEDGTYSYNQETRDLGHGNRSVDILKEHIDITREEEACIRYHMGAFTDKEEWSDYTNAIHRYPNVLWTHTADMVAAHILEME